MWQSVPKITNALLLASFLTYHGQWNLKPFMNFEEAVMSHLAFALQKNSELKSMMDFHILKMLESGVMPALKRYLSANKVMSFYTRKKI
jgi:hypothetical protein